MFVESVHWSDIIMVAVLSLVSIMIIAFVIYKSYKKENGEIKIYVAATIFILLSSVVYTIVSIEYTIESTPIDYTLKEPLEINIDRGYKSKIRAKEDSGGSKIIPSKSKDKITEKISFAKGDVVKIKTIEEYDVLSREKKRDWKNASVFIIYEDKLLELNYEDIKNQEIDKLLMSIYNEE